MKQINGHVTEEKLILVTNGYREYEDYLARNSEKVKIWGQLHDTSGNILERKSSDHYSIFCLSGGVMADNFGQGLLLTDPDLEKSAGHELRVTAQWRINKAMAQRTFYLDLCNGQERITRLMNLEHRYNRDYDYCRPLSSLGERLGFWGSKQMDYKDFGYMTRFSSSRMSRHQMVEEGIYTKIGKYFRSIICLAPMPDASGSIDAMTTSAMCHMLSVIPRNFEFKDVGRQVGFAKAVLNYLSNFEFPEGEKKLEGETKTIWRRNVCAAIGTGNGDVDRLRGLYRVGIRSFRLYSVATDISLREMTKSLLREISGLSRGQEKVELFVGQITSVAQFEDLVSSLSRDEWGNVDGIYLGNGGGSKCKTAETGMIVSTAAMSYFLRNHPKMRGKSIIVEGGVGNEPAAALLLGASGLSYSAGVSGGCIESPGGALYIYQDNGGYWKPYRGEASPSAKIIEGVVYPTGDAKQVEGANGFVRMEKKYPSMCGKIRVLNEWLAQCFVKLGVYNLTQLHALGAVMTESEVRAVFGKRVEGIPDIVSLQGKDGLKYTIPFPLFQRTEAQRQTASAYGLGYAQLQANRNLIDIDYSARVPA